jgi:hypothetical protein
VPKRDYSEWSKEELIRIHLIEKCKKYGLIWHEERTKEQFKAEAKNITNGTPIIPDQIVS